MVNVDVFYTYGGFPCPWQINRLPDAKSNKTKNHTALHLLGYFFPSLCPNTHKEKV